MKGFVRLLAAALSVFPLAASTECRPNAPCYSALTIVNAASGAPGALAPNTLASVYGTGLAFTQQAMTGADIQGGMLPVLLPGTGVQIVVGNLYAQIYFVSPNQVNFLVPSTLRAGEVTIQLLRDGTAGPAVQIALLDAAPALFQMDETTVVASHADFSLVSAATPMHPGEWVVLWATGLGEVTPPASYGEIPLQAAELRLLDAFLILLDGRPVAADRIGYAGVAPGWCGLFQINLLLPDDVGRYPEVRLIAGGNVSPPGIHVFAEAPAP